MFALTPGERHFVAALSWALRRHHRRQRAKDGRTRRFTRLDLAKLIQQRYGMQPAHIEVHWTAGQPPPRRE